MQCDQCQSVLLDHLYGLLDPAETGAVEEHLAGCPGCTAARAQAARAQGLFARAAKLPFPQVRFTPPTENETIPASSVGRNGRPAPAPARRGLGRPAAWARWAVAAGVLVMVPGALVSLSGRSAQVDAARRDAETAATTLTDAKSACERVILAAEARYAAAKEKHDAALTEWVAAGQAADRLETDRPVTVGVTKPLAVQPGAPNDFVVSVHDRGTALRGSRVEAQVRDQAGTVLFSQAIDPERHGDTHRVRLPAEVWGRVDPQAELFLTVAAVDEKTNARTPLHEQIRLYGPVYATMLVTDKMNYRPGERMYFRSLTLDRVTFRPPAREQPLHYSLCKRDGQSVPGAVLTGTTALARVAGGAVEPVAGPDGRPLRGVGCGAFALPADLPDGDYVLTMTEQPGPVGLAPVLAAPVTRTVKVRAGAAERYAKRIGFEKASFAPGQLVEAWAELTFQGAGVPGVMVSGVATADGKPIPFVRALDRLTLANGRARLRFSLPPADAMPRGDVRLMVTFRTPEAVETVAERVPLAGKDVTIEFFPEGGKLVAGVPNRVYVRGTTPAGRPVDVRGEVTDGTAVAARVESPVDADEPGLNRGLGSFTFTPVAGAAYRLKLQTAVPGQPPAGFDVPPADPDGVVMTVLDPVTAPGQPVRVQLAVAGRERNLVVGAYTRGRLADTRKAAVGPGKPVEIKLLEAPDPRGGVTRVTVFEVPAQGAADLLPVCERLVFRKPGAVLNLSLGTAPGAAPGQPVDLSVAATDEAGNPVPAVLWAAVVNTAVAPGAKDRSLPTHFLLAGEVQTPDDLEHADFLLTDHPRAAAALDHVLATQGWRRFVEQLGVEGVSRLAGGQRGLGADRLLVMNGQLPVSADAPRGGKHHQLFETFWPRFDAAAKDLDAARTAKAAGGADPVVRTLFREYETRRQEMAAAAAAVRAAAEPLAVFRGRATLAAGTIAGLAAAGGIVLLLRVGGWRNAVPLLLAAAGAGGLAAFLASGDHEVEVAGLDPWPELGAAETSTPAGTPDAPLTPKMIPVPSESPHLNKAGPVVKGANTGTLMAEPSVRSTIGPPQVVQPPPAIPHAVRPMPTFPSPLRTIPVADTVLIPDDRLSRDAGAEKRAGGVRTGGATLAPVLEADRKAVAEFSARQADSISRRMTAAFGGLQPTVSDPAALDRMLAAVMTTPPLVVREFAAPRSGPTADDPAVADTILWQPVIVLPGSGKTTLSFQPGTAPGGYQVLVAGHTLDGRLGTVRMILPVVMAGKDAPASPK